MLFRRLCQEFCPAKFHAPVIELCARAGKDIFCEKPLTLTLEEADAALAAVATPGVRLQAGHVRRYDPPNVDAKKRIEAGEIGEPVIFKSISRDPEPPPASYLESDLNKRSYCESRPEPLRSSGCRDGKKAGGPSSKRWSLVARVAG